LRSRPKPTEKSLLRDQEILYTIIDGLLKNFRGMKGIDMDA
jgi:hypothetical protein